MKLIITIILTTIIFSTNAQLQKLFEAEAQYQHLNGVILVTKSDSVVFEGCYGLANENQKITPQTRFDIGSITKQFTAAAILHLVKSDKIALENPINDYLGELASKQWGKVTVHQLLTHTGGIPSLYQTEQGLELFLPEETPIPLKDLVAKFSEAKLTFSPGKDFNYSNSGYILLGAIIQEVSGKTYADFMQTEIFDKYGLSRTTVGKPNEGQIANPYYGYRSDLLRNAPLFHDSWFLASGGIYSTVEDLNRWIGIISSDTFLDEKLRKLFLERHTQVGYGYGWQFPKKKDVIEHDGGNAGFISSLSFNPKTEETVIILTNRSFEVDDIFNFGKSSGYVDSWKNEIWKSLEGEELEGLPVYQSSIGFEGIYQLKDDRMIELQKQDTLLKLKLENTYASRLIGDTPLEGNTAQESKMLDIADYLERGKYWSLAKHCDGEMKFVMYSGLMSIGMRMLKKKVGKATEFIPYYVEDGHGLIRMKGTDRILDLISYFNDEGELIGIFENGYLNLDKEVSMLAYPVEGDKYYLDGIPYGEKSAQLEFNGNQLIIRQEGREVIATKIN